MLNRRSIFNLGLWGSAGVLLSWPARSRAQISPVTMPFLDPLPLPPAPGKVAPFSDLDPAAGQYRYHAAPLYVDPNTASFYRIVAEVRSVKFHSQLPPTEIWGYRDGSLPASQPWDFALGPTFNRPLTNNPYGPTIVRHVNELPRVAEHVGFGEPRNSVHLHGGHQAARSDGYPTDFVQADGTPFKVTFEHGEHFDYVYPLLAPGFFDDRENGTSTQTDQTERPSTLWYHDHIIDFTSQNVYRGLAGFFLVHDDPKETDPGLLEHIRDTGDEKNRYGVPNALRLPSGDFDVPMVLHEKTFGRNGELIYDVFNTDGFLGEKFLVNGKVQPYLAVKRRKYRFRFLNGSNARIYQLFLADKNGKTYPMTQIATEGGLLAHTVSRPSFHLAMAERVEVVIDFSKFKYPQFSELYIENRLLQDGGRGPKGTFERPELAARGTQLLKFKLEEEVADPSRLPYVLRPFDPVPAEELAGATIRNFVFERGNGQWQINGKLAGDLSRVVAQPVRGRGEIWRLTNKSGGWWHPIHVHHEFLRVQKRNGKLPFDGAGRDFGQSVERDGLARKDTISLGPNSVVEVFVKYRDHTGPFVFHCHNMEHEDHAMMARFDVV